MSWLITPTSTTWVEGGVATTIVVGGITYRVHAFTTVGTSTLTVLNGGELEYLVVGGGGGGGAALGGGGGAGGFLAGSFTLIPQTYTVTVGAGGIGSISSSVKGGN